MFEEHKSECVFETVCANIKKGKKEGYYLEHIDETILSKLRMEQVELAFNPSVFPPTEFNMVDVQMEMFDHFLRGILTDKGLEKLKTYHN